MRRVSVDPGKRYLGLACFDDDRLVGATLIKSKLAWPACVEDLVIKSCAFMGEVWPLTNGPQIDELLLEYPVVARSWGKADPNDLVALAFTQGALAVGFYGTKKVECIEPQTWKGTIDPDIVIVRIKGVPGDPTQPGKLFEVEKTTIRKDNHNVWDAIGLGLWKCGRLHAMRV